MFAIYLDNQRMLVASKISDKGAYRHLFAEMNPVKAAKVTQL